MTTLLVTGAAGFIGSNFVRYWLGTHPGDRVVALDALTYAGCRENLADLEAGITFVHGDIRDRDLIESLLREHRVDVVVNFAAESHNSLAIIRPGDFFSTNVMGTQALLEAARTVGVARFHQISTCEVYGDMDLDD
ncbi:NAD-dependent epimerase/dehydratase family protein, partial [Frankia sp. EI5c]|uniref:NAD-dependent epimerase/dehydratase family protein n=1 Tax=Frankia sp. EI5c TaxID=683316 RepID=UPI001F5BEE4B